VVVVDLPKSGQAAVLYGMRGLSRTDKDYFPLLVANSVFGGGYSARLSAEIRIKRGLSYGASSGYGQRLGVGPIVASAQTKNTTAVQVAGLIETELLRLGSTEVPADELAARTASLIGGFGRSVESVAGLSGQMSQLASFRLPLNKVETYVADVASVTPAQLRDVAKRIYDPKAANVVIAGDADTFFADMKKKYPDAERIPADKLNLDSASLK
jgi:zinc protease